MTGLDTLRAENERLAAELEERADFMRRQGYRECRTLACNCNSWHGGHASDRLAEIGDVIDSTGAFSGVTIIDAVRSLIACATAAESARATEREKAERLREAICWALGETDFRPREDGEPPYWWRTELRSRSGLIWDGEKGCSVLAETAPDEDATLASVSEGGADA